MMAKGDALEGAAGKVAAAEAEWARVRATLESMQGGEGKDPGQTRHGRWPRHDRLG